MADVRNYPERVALREAALARRNADQAPTRRVRSQRGFPRCSHRSGRADFPHPALRFIASLRSVKHAVHDAGLGQGMVGEQLCEARPRHVWFLRTAAEPFVPDALHLVLEPRESIVVSGHTEIPVVPAQFVSQRFALRSDRSVSILSTPRAHGRESPRTCSLIHLAVNGDDIVVRCTTLFPARETSETVLCVRCPSDG